MRLVSLALVLIARVAAAACIVPEGDVGNDCDGDGCTIGQGDCNDRPDAGGQFTRHAGCPNGAPLEVCDGRDNNCFAGIDEGDPGGGGACSTGMSGECNNGTIHCSDAGMVVCFGGSPRQEICDNLDNDCNGATDNGIQPRGCFTGPPGTYTGPCADAGAGCLPNAPCAIGSQNCIGGTWTACTDLRPQPERCDGVDNDCDLVADDGDPDGGEPCSTGDLGVCAAGLTHCSSGAFVCRQTVDAGLELCDGLDNDCNGTPDDGLTRFCFDGPSSAYTGVCPGSTCAPRSPCMPGTQACLDAGWSVCSGELLPVPETCDQADQNCDGVADDGNPDGGSLCSTGQAGVCAMGVSLCASSGIICEPITASSPEVCDGRDNDCNGMTDDGHLDGGVGCATGLPGVCGDGVTDCSDGGLSCLAPTPAVETCNGLDDDCNGVDDDSADGGTVCVAPKPLRSAYGFGCSIGGAPLAVLALLLARKRRKAMLAAVVLLPALASAEPLGLSFLGLKSNGVTPTEVHAVSEFVQSRLVARGGYHVTGPGEIEAIIGIERQRQLLGCDEGKSCLSEIAGALSSDRALSGQLARVGTSVLIDLSLFDPRTSQTIHRVGRRFSGAGALDEVLNSVDGMLDELIGRDLSMHPELAGQLGEAASLREATARPMPLVTAQLRGEADVYGSAVSRTAELTPAISVAWSPGLIGAAATVLLNPHLGVRVEGRLTPFRALRVAPHFALGVTAFLLGNLDLGLRAAAGAGTRLGPLWLSADVAYERLLFGRYLPDAVVLGLGLGWAFR